MDPRRNKDLDQKNYILAIVVAMGALLGFEYIFPAPVPQKETVPVEISVPVADAAAATTSTLPAAPQQMLTGNTMQQTGMESEVSTKRVMLQNDVFLGSVATAGGRVDELTLLDTATEEHGDLSLFSPSGDHVHFFDAGWQSASVPVPTGNTNWQAPVQQLTVNAPLTLSWDNMNGQTFTRTFTLQEDRYTIAVTDQVINNSDMPVVLAHYAQVHKADGSNAGGSAIMGFDPEMSTFFNFIGPLAYFDGIKTEVDYEDLEESSHKVKGTKGWVGITSRYFMAALVPDQEDEKSVQFKHSKVQDRDFYSVILQTSPTTLPARGVITESYRLYAGPKHIEGLALEEVELEEAVDFGWFHGIAILLYKAVMFFYGIVGNLGVAVILATFVLKFLLLPLGNKSYRAMAVMKKIQPRMMQLKEQYGDQREKFSMEMMALYREHKVNPMSGCWPMLIQIPIFFAFYKVILIAYPFRSAPFYGWIEDLSVMDPYFVLPVIMGLTMIVQQKLNPPAADPMQQKVMQFLPYIFTIMFAFFPAGLLLYWITNNVLSVAQQWYILNKISKE